MHLQHFPKTERGISAYSGAFPPLLVVVVRGGSASVHGRVQPRVRFEQWNGARRTNWRLKLWPSWWLILISYGVINLIMCFSSRLSCIWTCWFKLLCSSPAANIPVTFSEQLRAQEKYTSALRAETSRKSRRMKRHSEFSFHAASDLQGNVSLCV